MHRVHAPAAAPPSVVLSSAEAHHLTHVLRLGAGDDVIVFDGAGREWAGRVASVRRASVAVDLAAERTPTPEPPVHVTLGIAVLKGDQIDAVVRDATMLGAAVIAPFVSAHVALPERAWRNRPLDRLTRVAVSSARQCSRAVVPDVRPVSRFETLLEDGSFDKTVVCVEPARERTTALTLLPAPRRALVLVGPEGGWAADELDRAQSGGAAFLGLGPRTLRADAAPIVALSVLWTNWGWT